MPDVFVSYSRRDAEFVQRLAESVSSRGKELWLDTDGIADAEVFPQAIREAIEQSDAFLFVITPAAVESAYCENEVEYARELQKRIVPVLRERVPDPQLPAEIRDRNWIPFTDSDEFDTSLERLVGALDRDLEHAKAHTRWLVKAIEWHGEHRDRSFLLRGAELKAAEQWLASSPEDADPAPTPLQREYLLASRQAAARRQRTLVGASFAVAAVAVGLLIFALISRSEAESQKVAARAQALAAESQAQLPNDPEISVLLATRAVREQATAQTMFALRSALDSSPLLRTLPSVREPGSCGFNGGLGIAVSPDGRQVAEADCNGTLLLANPLNGRILRHALVKHNTAVVAYDPAGGVLALGTETGVELLDPASLAMRARLPTGAQVYSLAFSHDGSELAAAGEKGLIVWSMATRRPLLRSPGSDTGAVVFSRDGRLVMVGSEGRGPGSSGYGVAIYAVQVGRLLHLIATPGSLEGSYGAALAVSPDGSELAIGYPGEGTTNLVSIYSSRTWKRLFNVASIASVEIAAVAFSPNGKSLAVGAEDGTAGIWSLRAHTETLAYDGPTAAVGSLAFMPGGASLVTASNDGTARLWSTRSGEVALLRPRGFNDNTLAIELLSNTRLGLIGESADSRPFDGESAGQELALPSGRLVRRVRFPRHESATVDETGTLALLTPESRGLRPARSVLWSITRHRALKTLPAMQLAYATFSPDATRIAVELAKSEGVPGNSEIIDLKNGHTVTLEGSNPCGFDKVLVWSRDGRRVAAGGFCGAASVWDAASGRLLRRVNEGGELSGIALNGDGSQLLVGSWDSRATIWSVASGRPLVNLIGHTRGISGVALSRDGSRVLTSSLDHTVRLWNARTGHVMRIFKLAALAQGLGFSPDGSRIVFGDVEGNMQVWKTCPDCEDPRALLAIAAPHEHDQLTTLERTVAEQPG